MPTIGISSISFDSSISVLTTSNGKLCPSTVFWNEYLGMSVLMPLNLYCSCGTPFIVAFFAGLPKTPLAGSAAFITFINCSYHCGLLGSFHVICCPDKLKLFESTTSSVVFTDVIFN